MARRRVFKTEAECRHLDLSTRRRLASGQTVGLRKSPSGCGIDAVLDDVAVGSLPDAVAAQVASAIDRGQSFSATITECWESENGVKCLRLKVEYLLEKGEPAILVPQAQPDQAQQPRPAQWRTFYTKVAGVSFDNSDGSSRQAIVRSCRSGEPVRLIREPDNPHDEFAVMVVRRRGEQMGYLPSEVAGNRQGIGWCVGRGMDEGYRYIARVASVGQNEDGICGLSLQVTFWQGSLALQPVEEPELPPVESRYDAPPASPSKPQDKWKTTHTSVAGASFYIEDGTERQRNVRTRPQGEPQRPPPPRTTSTVKQKSGCLTLLCIAALFIVVVLLTR